MKYLLLFIVLIPFLSQSQVTHSVGVGTFVNYSKQVNLDETLDTIVGINQDVTGRVNFSPYLEYTLGLNRFNASVGVGYWQNSNKAVYDLNAGFISISVETKTKDHGIFFPVSIGYDLVHSDNLNIGLKARTNFRYLTTMDVEASTPFGSYNTTLKDSDLDTLDATRFFVSPGIGIYGGYEIGRFMPSLELGALYDLQGAYETQSDKNKYLNLYAAVSVRFRFCGVKNEDGATR